MVVESVKSNFIKSKKALIEYLKKNEKNPTEVQWDKFAINENYLSSKTMGYIDGDGFNKMCKKLRKEIKKVYRYKKN